MPFFGRFGMGAPRRATERSSKGPPLGQGDADALELDDAFFSRLERMSLSLQRVGAAIGGRPGTRRVPAADFIDHRAYSPGDDLRHIDWNAAARHDGVFVKVGRATQSADVHILLDASRSMAVLAQKWRMARELAAALAWMSLAKGDRVTLATFPRDASDEGWAPARGKGRGRDLVRYLSRLEPASDTESALEPAIGSRVRASLGGLIVIISDLWLSDELDLALALAPAPRWDLLVLQVLDSSELRPPLEGASELVDAETGERMLLQVDSGMRHAYREALAKRLERLRITAGRQGASYAMIPADWPVEQAVVPYLRRRAILER